MLVVEKTHHIKANINGNGAEKIFVLIKEKYPEAQIIDEDEKLIPWKETSLSKVIQTSKTPGKLLRAYRNRLGFSLIELADAVGTKYPNISAMENDRRPIGLAMAKKLGVVLKVDYHKFFQDE